MTSVPRSEDNRVIPVGGPRHYPVKTCAERSWHSKVRVYPSKDYKCEDCGEWGDLTWAQGNLRRQGDFLLELGEAIEDLARTQIREHRMIFDSDNDELNEAAERAGGKQ